MDFALSDLFGTTSAPEQSRMELERRAASGDAHAQLQVMIQYIMEDYWRNRS